VQLFQARLGIQKLTLEIGSNSVRTLKGEKIQCFNQKQSKKINSLFIEKGPLN